jgi:hypothetical protein
MISKLFNPTIKLNNIKITKTKNPKDAPLSDKFKPCPECRSPDGSSSDKSNSFGIYFEAVGNIACPITAPEKAKIVLDNSVNYFCMECYPEEEEYNPEKHLHDDIVESINEICPKVKDGSEHTWILEVVESSRALYYSTCCGLFYVLFGLHYSEAKELAEANNYTRHIDIDSEEDKDEEYDEDGDEDERRSDEDEFNEYFEKYEKDDDEEISETEKQKKKPVTTKPEKKPAPKKTSKVPDSSSSSDSESDSEESDAPPPSPKKRKATAKTEEKPAKKSKVQPSKSNKKSKNT